jgi:hypothetical protein
MAKRTFSGGSISFATPTALGSVVTNNQFLGIIGGSATQYNDILECIIQGVATASAIFGGVLARVSTASATRTALAAPASDGPNGPFTAALAAVPVTFTAATTTPLPSSTTTDTKFPLVINAFGGLYRENFAPTQQFSIYGTTTPVAEACLFNCTGYGGAACSVVPAIIYEPQ